MENPKQILITGATGFIAGAVARRWNVIGLGRLGEVRIRALVRRPQSIEAQALANLGIELVDGDLANSSSFTDALAGCGLVIHAAADTGITSIQHAQAVGVQGTRDLYRAAARAGVSRFIFISSLDVYSGKEESLDESIQLEPSGDPYADAKLAAERALLEESTLPGAPALVILRFPAVYGPGSRRWTLEPIQNAKQNRLSVPGTGEFFFPYLFVEDMIDAVTAAASTESPGVYNVYDGVTTYREFMGHYARMLKTPLRSTSIPVMEGKAAVGEVLGQAVGRYPRLNRAALRGMLRPPAQGILQPEKAMRELGWHPRTSLEEGMDIIERSNGFHKPEDRRYEPDPWKENEEWVEEKQ